MSYVGVPINPSGGVKGSGATRTAVNSQPAEYLSVNEASANFLKVGHGSFQYTAGPDHSPIGASWE